MRIRKLFALSCALIGFVHRANAQLAGIDETRFTPSALSEKDHFGRSLDLGNDCLVVGAEHVDLAPGFPDTGAVFVFNRSNGVWNTLPTAVLTPPPTFPGENFGASVAVSNGTIAVGAPGRDDPQQGAGTGSVYVYEFDTMMSSWALQQGPILSSGANPLDQFGSSVAIENDRLVVGARFDDPSGALLNENRGRAYIFERAGTVWTEFAVLEASDADNFDAFGTSVALSGSTIVIGAVGEDGSSTPDAGAAYVFELQGMNWVEQAKLTRVNATPQDCLGFSVSIDTLQGSSDTIVVGGPFAESAAGPTVFSGVACVFVRSGTVWTQQAELLASDREDNDKFGGSVSVGGDLIVAGAWNDSHSNIASGSAYLFQRTGTIWTEQAKMVAGAPGQNDRFGWSVSLNGSSVAIGAWQYDSTSETNSGAVHSYEIADPTPTDLCSGDGGNQMGCTNCPCSNNATVGTIGGCLNSVLSAARLTASGTGSISANNLHFEVIGGVPNSSAAVLQSGSVIAPANPMNVCFGLDSGLQSISFDGLRCAVGMIVRHAPRPLNSMGNTDTGWGPPDGPLLGLAFQGGYVAGQTRFFQVVYRDNALLSCMTGLNTTQAVKIPYYP